MGAMPKGRNRDTSMKNRQVLTNQITSSILTSGTRAMLVHYLALLFPQFAPLIYAAYLIYKYAERAIFAYKQYTELTRTMSEQRAALIASGLWAFREGMIYVKDRITSNAVSSKINAAIVSFVASGKFSELTLEMVQKDRKKQEKLQYLLNATISQFVTGATIGSNDLLIQEAAKLLV
ncbi:MAG: hypothetical protein HY222_00705 [Thaumarchaeota archaeon]|nr:hypothetical protein [Nitrososphaerota archaeon]